MKKPEVNNIVLYFSGLMCMSLGVVLAVKSDYGITVATSIAYVLNAKLTFISFGTFNYIVQGIVFLLMMLILREVKIKYVMSFVTAVLFGFFVDFFSFLIAGIEPVFHYQRAGIFIFSVISISLAIALFIKSRLPLMPFDIFCKKVSEKYGIPFGKFKMGFDIVNLVISSCLSFVLLGGLKGIYFGTLVLAVMIGPGVQIALNLLTGCFTVNEKLVIE